MPEQSEYVFADGTHYCLCCMNPVRPGQSCEICGMAGSDYTPMPHHLPLGTVLRDRYLIGRALGEGGFGITYVGRDLRLDLRVAVKEYYPAEQVIRQSANSLQVISRLGTGESQRFELGLQRFLREARSLAKMEKQPEIVTVRDFFEENGTGYLVMEYVDGISLKEWARRQGGTLTPDELLPVLEPLFSALGVMHDRGLVHRDISPDNLMLEHGAIRLLDFGCARPTDGDSTMTISLKQGFAPIEQYQRKGQGPWTDVYALAATIHFCLTGLEPPPSLDRILEDEMVPIQTFHTGLTPAQEHALMRGLAVQPRRRYQTMAEFHAGLYPAEGESASTENPDASDPADSPDPVPAQPVRKRRHWPWICLAVGVVLLVGLLLLALSGGRDTPAAAEEDAVQVSEETALPAESPAQGVDRTRILDPDYIDETFRDARSVSEESALRAALADETVPAVVLEAFLTLDFGSLELTKPLLIRTDAGLSGSGVISVSGGGWLCLEGSLGTRLFLRTQEGGCVSVTDTGSLSLWYAWLETEEDLLSAPAVTWNLYGGGYSDPAEAAEDVRMEILSENALFSEETSLRVSTEAELRQAMAAEGTDSIIVTAGSQIQLIGSLEQTKALLVEEGASLSLPVRDGQETHWQVQGAVLVNRGTLNAAVTVGDGTACCIVNEGTITGQLNPSLDTLVLNLGTLDAAMGGTGCLVNLGQFRGSGRMSGEVFNCGSWSLQEDALTLEGRVDIVGSLELLPGAEMTLSMWMYCGGELFLADGATLICDGLLQCGDSASLTAETGSSLTGQGLLQVAVWAEYQVPEECAACRVLLDPKNSVLCPVWDEDTLRAAQEESPEAVLLLETDLLVSGDLTLTQPVYLNDSCTLTVTGTLTLSGSDARITNGAVQAGHLELTQGALLLSKGDLTVTEGLSMGEDALVILSTWSGTTSIQGSLTIHNGGRLVGAKSLVFSETELILEGNGMLYCPLSLALQGCTVQVSEENGRLYVGGDFQMDEDSTLINSGMFQSSGDASKLQGTVCNHRWMELTAYDTQLAGSLLNDGELTLGGASVTISGTLENTGTVRLEDGVSLEISEGGTLSGTDF